jgi:hypothetical protein
MVYNLSTTEKILIWTYVLSTLGSMGYLVFRLGRLVEKVDQIMSNHLPHIYEELQWLRKMWFERDSK